MIRWYISALIGASFVVFLSGCATSAPPLPRATERTTETGYTAASASQSTTILHTKTKPLIVVSRQIWSELSVEEKDIVTSKSDVRVFEPEGYGLISDVQTADQSTQGSNAGAALGSAVASAAYIDRGLRGNNYSAVTGLAVGILGAALGSTLDTGSNKAFQFRYTVQLGDGEIRYFDESKSTPFRHSVGVCVSIPDLMLISQQVCKQTVGAFRQRHLAQSQVQEKEVLTVQPE